MKLNSPQSTIQKTRSIIDDPLSRSKRDSPPISENLTISEEQEQKVSTVFNDATVKKTTGSIFNLRIDLSATKSLCIGVKDFPHNILAVSMLKRNNGYPGPGELAGLRIGDIIFGINFHAVREGSKTLLQILKRESEKEKKSLHLQCWRCYQICDEPPPGSLFKYADDIIVQSYSLYRSNVFSSWEQWNFIEILLSHMVEDLKARAAENRKNRRKEPSGDPVPDESEPSSLSRSNLGGSALHVPQVMSVNVPTPGEEVKPVVPMSESTKQLMRETNLRSKQMMMIDLEKNILQAKGLRTALCVRVVHTKTQAETVLYVLRVEDVETGLQWVVHRRYREFSALNDELCDIAKLVKDVDFPKKKVSMRHAGRLVEMRIVALEQYVRRVLHLLTLYATMDQAYSRALRHLQNFLGVSNYIDCIHPPPVDDQRFVELLAYRFLNDFSSPACQQCVRFVTTVNLDALTEPGPEGYRPVLQHVNQALAEVEQFVLQQHGQQMTILLSSRRPDLTPDELRAFIRKCVRRQVEASVFLPLRRTIFRIVYSFVAVQSQKIQQSMSILEQVDAHYFTVDPYVQHAQGLPRAVKAFRDVVQAYLPADQGQLLMHAALAVMDLHSECEKHKQALKEAKKLSESRTSNSTFSPEASVPPTPPMDSIVVTQLLSEPFDTIEDRPTCTSIEDSLSTDKSNSKDSSRLTTQFSMLFTRSIEIGTNNSISTSSTNSSIPSSSEPLKFTDNTALANHVGDMFEVEENRTVISASNPQSAASLLKDWERAEQEKLEKWQGEDLNAEQIRALRGKIDAILAPLPSTPPPFSQSTNHLPEDSSPNISRNLSEADPSFNDEDRSDQKEGEDDSELFNGEDHLQSPLRTESTFEPSFSTPPPMTSLKAALFEPTPRSTREKEDDPLGGGASAEGSREEEEDGASPREGSVYESTLQNNNQHIVVSADDFLPLFTFVLVQASLPQLLLVKELMTALVDDEETFGECGYYLATLEASTQHLSDLAESYRRLPHIGGGGERSEDRGR